MDQYEKDKEDKLKEFQHEKRVLQTEIENKNKKLEVALGELKLITGKRRKGGSKYGKK